MSKGVTNVLLQPPAPGVVPAGNGVDKTWVSFKFEIDPKELASAWDAAKVPAALGETVFLNVKVERQERRADGTWSGPTTVPSLSIHQHDPVPEDAAPVPKIAAFLEWAQTHQKEILQPEFYARIKGDEWVVPGTNAPAMAAAPVFDPSKYPNQTREELIKLGLDQKQIDEVFTYRRAHPPARGAQRGAAPRGAAPRGTPRGGRGTQPPPDEGAAEFEFAPQMSSGAAVNFQAAAEEAPAPNPEEAAANAANPGDATAVAPAYPVPTGLFDPHKWTGNGPVIIGWAHDDTALPGHTYQYRVTYVLKNPLYFAAKDVKNPATAKVFSISSPPSAWSDSVEIPSTLNYFIAKTSGGAGTVTFDVYRNQGGVQNWKSFEVSPGDMIGGKDGGVDYTTGETMLDVRTDLRTQETYVLLMDPNGQIHRRDIKEDSNNPKYAQLKQAAGRR
jgi:hypothetical protein